jgi:lipopolysaccharide export system permease protein
LGRLDRYIAASLFKGWLLVWVIISAIFSLLAFVDELERITHLYRMPDVVRFILYTLPQRSMDLIPVISLLGTLVALAAMNKNSEIIAMRTAGMSFRRFFRAVAVPAVLLVVVLYAVSQFVSAPLYRQAETEKSVKREGRANLLEGKGLWSASDYRFFNVRTLQHGNVPSGIYLYQFSPDGRLLEFVFAQSANPAPDREWRLMNVQQKSLVNGKLQSNHKASLETGPFWSTEELPIIPLSIMGMTLTGLYEYADYLRDTNQKWQAVEQLFWQKVALPLTAGAMVLLAAPIGAAVSTQRASSFGKKLAIGASAGIVFYLASQIINTAGTLIGMPPALVAFIPMTLVLITAAALFYHLR